ncbi:hypothetical protein IC229_01050 [Spirosoma sp. BT702]|uniref:Uncharacterized protein n=1 Tax=Spirosoma profusum TaxID=2771354 RepID=A0A926XSW7_9BACT|nr:hypothetical protein [Spirosoma profusum]MBD2699202.1 hypothetical protein [Spirosoma profusum]
MNASFFDRRLVLNVVITLIGCALLLYCIKIAIAAHLPFLVATLLATAVGVLEPRRGWFLAIVQAATIWIVYTFFLDHPTNNSDSEVEVFSLYGSMILSFVGSFIGGGLKRVLDRSQPR